MENEKLTFTINNVNITVEAFHFGTTYSSLLIGTPTKEINDLIIKDCDYPLKWGNRKAKYKRDSMYVSPDVLKPFYYSAWLTSTSTINDTENIYVGSEVIANWFGHAIGNKGILDFIKKSLEGFDWEKYAENYNF